MKPLKFNYTRPKPKKKRQIIRLISKDHTIYPELVKAEAEKLNKIINQSEVDKPDINPSENTDEPQPAISGQ